MLEPGCNDGLQSMYFFIATSKVVWPRFPSSFWSGGDRQVESPGNRNSQLTAKGSLAAPGHNKGEWVRLSFSFHGLHEVMVSRSLFLRRGVLRLYSLVILVSSSFHVGKCSISLPLGQWELVCYAGYVQIFLVTDLFTCSFPGRMSQYYRRPSPWYLIHQVCVRWTLLRSWVHRSWILINSINSPSQLFLPTISTCITMTCQTPRRGNTWRQLPVIITRRSTCRMEVRFDTLTTNWL